MSKVPFFAQASEVASSPQQVQATQQTKQMRPNPQINAANAPSCQIPQALPTTPPKVKFDYANLKAPVDYYLLAISWSPQYCYQSKFRSEIQCQLNQFAWVVHGLWPQNGQAKNVREHPRFCQTTDVPQNVMRQHLCMMPDPKLIQGEWQKHGSCAFSDPAAYYSMTQKLWELLQKPMPISGQTVGELKQAFIQKNKGLKPEHLVVTLNQKKYLKEVRICYNKAGAYQACPMKSTPDFLNIKVTQMR